MWRSGSNEHRRTDHLGASTIIRGTTDLPVSFDPAGAYDLPSYDVIGNVFQTVLTFRPGDTEPRPDAAERCEFETPTLFECQIREGLTFSDGSPLTSEDVKFSFDRNIGIADPRGASSLLSNLERVDAPDERTVRFRLKEPDAIFPYVISEASFAIVPSDRFPEDELQPSEEVVGSGRYTVAQYEPGRQTVLEANPEYSGEDPPRNERAIFQYFDRPSALKLAIEQGEIDIAYRSLSPTDIADLRENDGLEVIEGTGTELRYIGFNLDLQPGETPAEKLAIRRALAQSIDREAIAENIYNGGVKPMYSMVPDGIRHATRAFEDRYGTGPDPEAARRTLEEAGVEMPVPLELWWTPSHYGPASGDEYAEIARQLEADGVFEVALESTEWTQYSEAARSDKYPVFQYGWFPDYPDADNFTAPFYATENFLANHYSNKRVDELLSRQKVSDDAEEREQLFAEIQEIAARETPVVPVWQGTPTAIVGEGVEGIEDALDVTSIFRFWLISKE